VLALQDQSGCHVPEPCAHTCEAGDEVPLLAPPDRSTSPPERQVPLKLTKISLATRWAQHCNVKIDPHGGKKCSTIPNEAISPLL
jgi:hypothetical protein